MTRRRYHFNIADMRLWGIALIFAGFLIFAPCASALLFTDDTSTTDKGQFEVEYWVQYYKDTQYDYEENCKTKTRQTRLYLYMLYGLTDNWEVGLTIPYGYINYDSQIKQNGFMDIEIETKYRLIEEKSLLPSFALYVDYITGSANEEKSLGCEDEELWLNGILSKTLKESLWLDLNLGYYFTGGKATDDAFIYSISLSHGFLKSIYVYAELYAEVEFERNFNDNVLIGALSLGYEINPRLFLKTGAGVGISDGADDLMFSCRMSFSF